MSYLRITQMKPETVKAYIRANFAKATGSTVTDLVRSGLKTVAGISQTASLGDLEQLWHAANGGGSGTSTDRIAKRLAAQPGVYPKEKYRKFLGG